MGLRGDQHPRVMAAPSYVTTWGPAAVELCAKSGVFLDPWQQLVLEHGMGRTGFGADAGWSAFEVATIVSRQNGKGEIMLARELAGLFLFDERLIVHTAHEFKTAKDGFKRVKAVINAPGNYHLRRRVKTIREANGEQGIELHSGAELRFLARTAGSGRGMTGDCVFLDEAYELDDRHMSALLPTLSARPDPQVWYFSSAGMVTSQQLGAVRARGLAAAGLER